MAPKHTPGYKPPKTFMQEDPSFPPQVRAFGIFQAVAWAKKNKTSRFVLLGEHHKAVQDSFSAGAAFGRKMGAGVRHTLAVIATILAIGLVMALSGGCASPKSGPKPAAAPAPWVPAVRSALPSPYEAAKGESLWSVSKKAYGEGKLWPALVKGLKNPDSVSAGRTIVIPQALSAADVVLFRGMGHAHFVKPNASDPVRIQAPILIDQILSRPAPVSWTVKMPATSLSGTAKP